MLNLTPPCFRTLKYVEKAVGTQQNHVNNYTYLPLQVLNEKQHIAASKNEYNFDHPDAFDIELLISVLQRLKEGKKVEVPIYNYVTHARENRTVNIVSFILCSSAVGGFLPSFVGYYRS